jgi:hypothetical protein
MLPGFRFLFAAIVFSLSILVFGLGAAALLRAAHEQFASNPSWRGAPEIMLAQRSEASRPVLAMLRVEPTPTAQKPDSVAAAPVPAEPVAVAISPEPATGSVQAEPERRAALRPEVSSPPETTKPETPAAQDPVPTEVAQEPAPAKAAPPPAEATPAQTEAPAPAEPTRIAATEQSLPANDAAPAVVAPEQISAPASPETDIAETKIATLGGPSVAIETPPPAKAASAKPEQSVIKKRQQARRAEQRRKAARARLAQQLAANPFAQQAVQQVAPVRTAELPRSSRPSRDRRPVGQTPLGPGAVVQR